MNRRRLIAQIVAGFSVIFLLIGENGVRSEPVGEIRTGPSYVQSRPVYSKPSPRPKLVLKPPQQLSIKEQPKPQEAQQQLPDVERITQTVYGFLDFVTTIGNTVMVFTPQTKKVEAVNVAATSTAVAAPATISVQPTALLEPEQFVAVRSPKQFTDVIEHVIEASEVEPQVVEQSSATPEKISPTPVHQQEIRTQVNVVSSSPNIESGEFIEGDFPQDQEEEQEEEVVSPKPVTTPPPPPPPQSKAIKQGFTLKLTPKHSSPIIVTPAISTPVVVTAQKVNLPPPPPPKKELTEPTGVLNQIYETKVASGTTTVVETKIIGTYIGTQYARVLESSSSIIPVKIEATKSVSFPSLVLPTKIFAQKAPPTSTTTTPPPSSSTTQEETEFDEDNNDTRGTEGSSDLPQDGNHGGEDMSEDGGHSSVGVPLLEPTPTASEEQTHYILPQKYEKKAEKIYVSAVPNPAAYSRAPQLYVDINPAKSQPGDVYVTATPSRGKQFRLSNSRFSGRLNKNQGSDSNELTHPQEIIAVPEDSTTRRSRFGRNRAVGGVGRRVADEVVPTVSVVSATPSRRFKSGTRTSSAAAVSSSRAKDFSSYKTARGFGGQNSRQAVQVQPTTSTSIYRFKLNRPTGRWRFKPSPKPKVNIIKTKEEEELERSDDPVEKEIQLQSPTNGPVYHQYPEGTELQQTEETRTESNEVGQEGEPELVPQTLRVATVSHSDYPEGEKYLEIATIKSPYVFQAGNVKNTRYITVTKTFTKELITPTLASSVAEATLENILATKAPYEKILEGSNDVATLPVIVLGGDVATPPLETITQSFSTTQLMLKTSILPVLYDGVTTLYTLTQSYFITRLVTAHKTVPPVELFQFVPTKSLTEFNTALQEAGSEHRDHLLGSESEDENDTNYEQIIAPPDELTLVGSDFDPSAMEDKLQKRSHQLKSSKEQLIPRGKASDTSLTPNPFATPSLNSIQDPLNNIAGLTPEQLAFIRYFTAQNAQQQQQQHQQQQQQAFAAPQLPPVIPQQQAQLQQFNPVGPGPQFSVTSSPLIVDTLATVTETKTLRLLFGAKPTHTVLYSTRVIPTKMTTYITASVPVKATVSNPFLNALPFPLAYVG